MASGEFAKAALFHDTQNKLGQEMVMLVEELAAR